MWREIFKRPPRKCESYQLIGRDRLVHLGAGVIAARNLDISVMAGETPDQVDATARVFGEYVATKSVDGSRSQPPEIEARIGEEAARDYMKDGGAVIYFVEPDRRGGFPDLSAFWAAVDRRVQA